MSFLTSPCWCNNNCCFSMKTVLGKSCQFQAKLVQSGIDADLNSLLTDSFSNSAMLWSRRATQGSKSSSTGTWCNQQNGRRKPDGAKESWTEASRALTSSMRRSKSLCEHSLTWQCLQTQVNRTEGVKVHLREASTIMLTLRNVSTTSTI